MTRAWDTLIDALGFCVVGTIVGLLHLIDRAFGLVLDWEDRHDSP